MKPTGAQLEKARAFWARKKQLCRHPGRCCRCGKPNANGKRQCDACLAWAADYRARRRSNVIPVESKILAQLERRIGAVEHYVARLRTFGRIEYNRGYVAGRRLHRAAQERASYFDALTAHSYAEATQ